MASDQLATAIVDTAAHRAREPRTQRMLLVLTVLVMVAAVVLFALYLVNSGQVSSLQQQAGDLRGQVTAVKADQADAAAKSQALADQVRALGQVPVVAPAVAGAGPAGRGIAGTAIKDGHLTLFFTDGTTSDAGQVAGAPGAAGSDGVAISAALLVSGHLMLTYSDGHTSDVGQVVGQPGAPGAPGAAGVMGATGAAGAGGADGADGRSVTSTANVDGHLIVTFSDGTTQDAGPLPAAVAGRPPASFSYTDALEQTHDCTPDTPPDPGASPHYSCN